MLVTPDAGCAMAFVEICTCGSGVIVGSTVDVGSFGLTAATGLRTRGGSQTPQNRLVHCFHIGSASVIPAGCAIVGSSVHDEEPFPSQCICPKSMLA